MRSLVIYYSRTGNTAYVADRLFDILKSKGEACACELTYAGFRKNVFLRLLYRFMPQLVRLAPVPYDLKDYDILCVGIPVITGYPSSAICKYLQMCMNLKAKKVLCLYVYGLEASARACSRYIEKMLQKKGVSAIFHAYIPFGEIHKKHFLDNLIKKTLEKLL